MRKQLLVLGLVFGLCCSIPFVTAAAQTTASFHSDYYASDITMEQLQVFEEDDTQQVGETQISGERENYKYGVFAVLLLGGVVLAGSAVIAKKRHS